MPRPRRGAASVVSGPRRVTLSRRAGGSGRIEGMDWQTTSETAPASVVPEARAAHQLASRAPATGAWREGDPEGDRRFVRVGALALESGEVLPDVRVAYESWGRLSPARDNAILVLHALTGDSHVLGPAGPGHASAGWWPGVVGPGRAIDTGRWFVVAPNVLGGCQGTTGPASLAPDGIEWGRACPPSPSATRSPRRRRSPASSASTASPR
ncbi:hypothetical protein GCM10025870_07350 [Agromyces marinus]|uniref:Homoserine O-acetyltransferase n=1 Tax=Agromyces marinus TaxID=1389020 RepID=A0ABN6Y8J1_9MICO|nr:hypothetical protein GCM10025870_07350 [Agromyces marinus]